MLSDRIKALREVLNLTQAEFGEKIGSYPSSISEWEHGKTQPKEATLLLIEYAFNVNSDWLRRNKGNMFKPEAVTDITPEIVNMITWIKSLSPKEQAWLDIELQDKFRKYKEWLETKS